MNIKNSLFFSGSAFKPYSAVHNSPEHNLTATSIESRVTFTSNTLVPFLANETGYSHKDSPVSETLLKEEESKTSSKKAKRHSKTPKEEAKETGRWTDEEQQRFLKAMELFGNSWNQVKEYIGTRTTAQIRSHAQKYYIGLRKKAIKKCKEDPKNTKALFVVVREYLNTSTFKQSHIQQSRKNQKQ